jgi:hypothetical protein
LSLFLHVVAAVMKFVLKLKSERLYPHMMTLL